MRKSWLQPSRLRVLLFMLVWTAFVAITLWWLLSLGDDVSTRSWVLNSGDSAQQPFSERARDWFRLVHLNFQRIYPWVLLGPYVAWLAWSFSLERGRLRLSLPVHLAACAVFLFASHTINERTGLRISRVVVFSSHRSADQKHESETNGVRFEVSSTSYGGIEHDQMITGIAAQTTDHVAPPDFLAVMQQEFAHAGGTNEGRKFLRAGTGLGPPPGMPTLHPLTTLLDLFAYAAIAGLGHAVHFYRRYRERERRALYLESNLAKARLGALQAQLQPHFLFNSLNAIAALLRLNPLLAETTLTSLSELLRLALSQSEKQEVPLREELEFVERYLEIQQTRFGERLRFEKEIEPATLDCLVPTLLLQPLIENAIRHGIEPSENAGVVRLTAHQAKNDVLILTVEDNGVGLNHPSASRNRGNGIGLPNLRARLEALYGNRQRLELLPRAEDRGVLVRVEIPGHRASIAVSEPEALAGAKDVAKAEGSPRSMPAPAVHS